MQLETMSLEDLKAQLEQRGLKAYGSKQQMIERIQTHDAADLAADPTPTEPTDLSNEVEPIRGDDGEIKVIEPSEEDILRYTSVDSSPTHRVNSVEEVKAIFEHLKSRFAGSGVLVTYGIDHDTFSFTGGPQGKVTTTAQQPRPAIEAVVRNYFNAMKSVQRNTGVVGA